MKLNIYSTGDMGELTPHHLITIGTVLKYIDEHSIVKSYDADIEIDEDFFTVTLETVSEYGHERTLQFGFSPSGIWFQDFECGNGVEDILNLIDRIRD